MCVQFVNIKTSMAHVSQALDNASIVFQNMHASIL